jgi:hypothetical protein
LYVENEDDESGKHEAEKHCQLDQCDGRRIFASHAAAREVGGWWEKAKTQFRDLIEERGDKNGT